MSTRARYLENSPLRFQVMPRRTMRSGFPPFASTDGKRKPSYSRDPGTELGGGGGRAEEAPCCGTALLLLFGVEGGSAGRESSPTISMARALMPSAPSLSKSLQSGDWLIGRFIYVKKQTETKSVEWHVFPLPSIKLCK